MDIISEAALRKELHTAVLGNRFELYQTIDSTNLRAKLAAQAGEPEGLCVIAEEQIAGRGRLGRSFLSPRGNGVYMSVLLRPSPEIEQPALLTAAVSVCVARAIEAVSDSRAEIKWVNDLFVRGKKVCGILTEAAVAPDGRQLAYAVVGIGVNLSDAGIPEELREIAGGIAPADVTPPSRTRLIAAILNETEEMLRAFSPDRFLSEYRSRSNVIGKQVTLLRNGAPTDSGTALDIDDQARLVVRLNSGEIKHLNSGEISCRAEF